MIALLVCSGLKAKLGGDRWLVSGEAWIGVTRSKTEIVKGAQVVQRAADEDLEGVALELLLVARAEENHERLALHKPRARDFAGL